MISGLQELGFVFTSTQQITEGEYLSSDVEWNYNDLPHLCEVHDLAERVEGVIAEDYAASILVQKVGPFELPMSLFNYAISRSENFYFTSFGPYVLLVQTKWTTKDQTTKVVTTYFLGSKKILKISHKLVHSLLAKNYRNLMKDDIPMRSRRGSLRFRGYTFTGDSSGNGFLELFNLAKCGVVAPTDLNSFTWECLISAVEQGTTLAGSNDNSGVRLQREDDLLTVFPRICMHAGASLDLAKIDGSCIKCPWHGRLIKPIFTVNLADDTKIYESKGLRVEVKNSMLFVSGLFNSE